jgi:hypothetical protein
MAVTTNARNNIIPNPGTGMPSGGASPAVNGRWKRTCCMGQVVRW